MKTAELNVLKQLLDRFIAICKDEDGRIDPADKLRIKKAARVLFKLEFPEQFMRLKQQ